jgi:two-component system chemotaxis response regulator CheY
MSLVRILVVDDEADVRKSVRMTLTKAGYDVVQAEVGDKAIK